FLSLLTPPYHMFSDMLHRRSHHPNLHSFPTRRSSDLWRVDWSTKFFPIGEQFIKCARLKNGARKDVGTDFGTLLNDANADLLTGDRKSTRLNSSHVSISYAVFCLKKKTEQ